MKVKNHFHSSSGILVTAFVLLLGLIFQSCSRNGSSKSDEYRIVFLHHSTGDVIWRGGNSPVDIKGVTLGGNYQVPEWFDDYNKKHAKSYQIDAKNFPNKEPYGWKNYPYDYYNIWVKHAGNQPFSGEPTLEILTQEYQMIIFKHCYPVSMLESDSVNVDIDSDKKTIENYKLQYQALKEKMLQFPKTKFVVWTGAIMLEPHISVQNALNYRQFAEWVRNIWDTQGDNIFVWDFYSLETEGGLFMKPEIAEAANNHHPNKDFAKRVAPLFCQRIVDIIETGGSKTTLTGEQK